MEPLILHEADPIGRSQLELGNNVVFKRNKIAQLRCAILFLCFLKCAPAPAGICIK